MTDFQSSSPIMIRALSRVIPADVTAVAIGPSSRSVVVTQSLTSAATLTSTRWWYVRAPSASASLATESAASCWEW
jgi:hypothetical protein